MDIKTISWYLVVLGLSGGLFVHLLIIFKSIETIIDLFKWKKVYLSETEKENLLDANKVGDNFFEKVLKNLLRERDITWKSSKFNNVTGVLKIKN